MKSLKKATQGTLSVLAVLALLLVPVVGVYAQEDDPIVIEDDPIVLEEDESATDEDILAPEETKGGAVAGSPDTGFGPTDGRGMANIAVFVGGSALGAALGFSALSLHRKYSRQNRQ